MDTGAGTGATMVNLLDAIAEFLEDDLKDLQLQYREEEERLNRRRGFKFFKQVPPLPEEESPAVPFILLQLVAGEDTWSTQTGRETCTATVRIIMETYDLEPERGKFESIAIVDKIRTDMKRQGVLKGIFELADPFEYLFYPDDTDTYHIAELSTVWKLPQIDRFIPTLRDDPRFAEFLHPGRREQT